MGKYTQAKCRLCRREGRKLFLKGERCFSAKCPLERKGVVPPGQHGYKYMRKKVSVYGMQLREKQKVKRIYGLREAQFKKLFAIAAKNPEATGVKLLQLLETRLDNVVYRLHFAPSRSTARQLVSHGHVLVNNKKVTTASYQLKVGDVVSLKPASAKIKDVVASQQAAKDKESVAWLQKKATQGKILRIPDRHEIDEDINEQLIVEFYSR
ncbi:MAG: 30S ribosomal protein S4 [bacterium]|nr:30S ribosomal protein S4 [bacterium]